MIEPHEFVAAMPTPIPLTASFRCKPGVMVRELDGEAVLLDVGSGRYFGLNATGRKIFELLDGERTLEEILQVLLSEHEVAREELSGDLVQLVSELRDQGLVMEAETAR